MTEIINDQTTPIGITSGWEYIAACHQSGAGFISHAWFGPGITIVPGLDKVRSRFSDWMVKED